MSGSAYTYAYATMGELLAWVIGWDLVLEYGVSVAAVAVGWGSYLTELFNSLFGVTLSDAISLPPGEGGQVNVPSLLLVLAAAALLISGVRQSARTNTVMVITKIVVLLFFIAVALSAFTGSHFSDFAPNGFGGVETAAALIFFAYIGFDAVSTGSEETKRPQRDLPIAIIGSLAIATVLYILVAVAVLFVPVFPLIGAALCVYLMTKLDAETWVRFGVWLVVGLVIYLLWGYRNSTLRRGGGGGSGDGGGPRGGRFQRDPSGAPTARTPEPTH